MSISSITFSSPLDWDNAGSPGVSEGPEPAFLGEVKLSGQQFLPDEDGPCGLSPETGSVDMPTVCSYLQFVVALLKTELFSSF